MLTCEVSGDANASVTWTKDGLSSIARAQFENNEKILIIRDVVPGDSGVYECKAMNCYDSDCRWYVESLSHLYWILGNNKICISFREISLKE